MFSGAQLLPKRSFCVNQPAEQEGIAEQQVVLVPHTLLSLDYCLRWVPHAHPTSACVDILFLSRFRFRLTGESAHKCLRCLAMDRWTKAATLTGIRRVQEINIHYSTYYSYSKLGHLFRMEVQAVQSFRDTLQQIHTAVKSFVWRGSCRSICTHSDLLLHPFSVWPCCLVVISLSLSLWNTVY